MGLVALALSARTRQRAIALLIASCLLGCALGSAWASYAHAANVQLSKSEPIDCMADAVDDSVSGDFGSSVKASIALGTGRSVHVTVLLPDDETYLAGERLNVIGTIKSVSWKEKDRDWLNGIIAVVTAEKVERAAMSLPAEALISTRRNAIRSLSGEDPSHALLQAIACGYRGELRNSDTYACYQSCGIAHLVAVSGAHLVIVTSLFASALKAARVPRRLAIALLVCVMVGYLVVAGMPVSGIRAAIMSSIGILALLGKRRSSSLNALGICMFAMLAAEPTYACSASFALSVLSTLGIVMFFPLVRSWFPTELHDLAAFALDSLSLTIAASLASQPFACSLFSILPLVGPFANIVAAPLFPIACSLGLVASLFGAIGFPASGAVLEVALAAARIMNGVASFLSSIPHAAIPIALDTTWAIAISAGMCALLWVAWNRVKLHHVIALMVAIALVWAAGNPLTGDFIVMLDVGQGDSFLIASEGATLLVDTGNQDAKLANELGKLHITHLDNVLVTHGDDDHCGSLDQIGKTVSVDRVLLAADALDPTLQSTAALVAQSEQVAGEVVGLEYGDVFAIGSFEARVVWPHEFVAEGGNADSVCLLVTYDADGNGMVNFRALFTGDAEADQLAEIVASGDVGDIDLLKVGHHGSRNGMNEAIVAALDPEIALIGVGKNNRYGHPSPEIIDLLDAQGCTVFRSDRDGEVRCKLTGDALSVSTLQ